MDGQKVKAWKINPLIILSLATYFSFLFRLFYGDQGQMLWFKPSPFRFWAKYLLPLKLKVRIKLIPFAKYIHMGLR